MDAYEFEKIFTQDTLSKGVRLSADQKRLKKSKYVNPAKPRKKIYSQQLAPKAMKVLDMLHRLQPFPDR